MEDSGDSSWSENLRRNRQYENKCRGAASRDESSTTPDARKHARSPHCPYASPTKAGRDPSRARVNLLTNVLNCFRPILPQLDIMSNRFLHQEPADEEYLDSRDSSPSAPQVGVNWFTCNCTFNPALNKEDQTSPHRVDSTNIIYQKAHSPPNSDTVMIVLDEAADQTDATSCATSSDNELTDQSSVCSFTTDESLLSIHPIDPKYSQSYSKSSKDHTSYNSIRIKKSKFHPQSSKDKSKANSNTYYTASSTLPPSYLTYVQQAPYLQHPCNKYEIYRTHPITYHENFSVAPDIRTEYQTNRLVCEQIQTEVESIIKHHASRFHDQTVDLRSSKRDHRRTEESDGSITDGTEESSGPDEAIDGAVSDTIQIELDFSSGSDATCCSSQSLCDCGSLCDTCRCDSRTCYSAHAQRASAQKDEDRRMRGEETQSPQVKASRRQKSMRRTEQVCRFDVQRQQGICKRERTKEKELTKDVLSQHGMSKRERNKEVTRDAALRQQGICKRERTEEVTRDATQRQYGMCKRERTEEGTRDATQRQYGICKRERSLKVSRVAPQRHQGIGKRERTKEVTQVKPKVRKGRHPPQGPVDSESERREGPLCIIELDVGSESESSVFKESSESSEPARYLADMRRRHEAAESEADDSSTLLDSTSTFQTTSPWEANRKSSATIQHAEQSGRAEILLQPSRKAKSCGVLPRALSVDCRRRPYTVMSRTQRQRNIFCSARRQDATQWRQDIMECFQTQFTLRLESAVRQKRGLVVNQGSDPKITEDRNKNKPKTAAEANTGDGRRVGILNCETTTISCQNKTTLYFSNENDNNFLNCTQSFSNNEDNENDEFCEEVNSDTINTVSKILAVESFIKRIANNVNNDPNVQGEHSRKNIDKAYELTTTGKLTGRLNDAISKIEIATRERQEQIKNRLEKLFEGARHLKSLEKLCNTYEPKIGEQKKFIEDTIQKGKVTVLQNVINLGKLVSDTVLAESEAGSSTETHSEQVTELSSNVGAASDHIAEAGPSKRTQKEIVLEHLNSAATVSDHKAVRRKMKNTLLCNPVQNINKAKNKIKNQIRILRNLRIKELSPRVSSSGEDIAVMAKLRAMIVVENFVISCPQLNMNRDLYLIPIEVRQLLSRIKLKRAMEYKMKRKMKIKKIKLKISMKNVPMLDCNKINNELTLFHLGDFLCRLCTVKQTLRWAMGDNEKSTMMISLNENVVNKHTLQPFTTLSVNNHFKKLSVDQCYLDLRRRTPIHISLQHVIKCDNIHLQVRPIEVINIDTAAIVLKAISFVGRDSTVENNFGYMRHNLVDLKAKSKINTKVGVIFHKEDYLGNTFPSGENNELDNSVIDIDKVISNSTIFTATQLQKICSAKSIFVLSDEKTLSEEERSVTDKNMEKSNVITIPSNEVLESSSEMLDDKYKSQSLKTLETNNTSDVEERSKYSIKQEEHVNTYVNNYLQMTLSSDIRSSEVMLMDTNLGTSSSHLLLRSQHSQMSQSGSWSKSFHQVEIKISPNEIDKDEYSSKLTINATNSKTMDTNVMKSNTQRHLSLSKNEIKFSSETIKPGALRDYKEVITEQKEDMEDARLLTESLSVTLPKKEIIIVDKTKLNTKHSECLIDNLEKKEIEENMNERNEEILCNFHRDLVVDKEKQDGSVNNSCENIFQSYNGELLNKLKDIYQGVDPILVTTKNMNCPYQDESIIEEQKTIKLEIIVKIDDKVKLEDALHSFLSTESQNSADQYDTRNSECLEKKGERTVSETPSTGTDGSSDSSNGMNLDVDFDAMNLYESEGQRILDSYQHTLETLSEKTERSSSTSTGVNTLVATLSNFRKILCGDLPSYIQCLESQFSFTLELQETYNKIMHDCRHKINKNDFTFRLNKINLKVNGKIRIHTGTHCYVTKPFFASRKQRNASKRKMEIKCETFHNVGVDVRNNFDMQHVAVDNSKTIDLEFLTDNMDRKILENSSGNSAVTMNVNQSQKKLVEGSTNSSNVSTRDLADITEVTLESSKTSHIKESASIESLSQSNLVDYSITDEASLEPVTEKLEVNTETETRLPRSLTFIKIDCRNTMDKQRNCKNNGKPININKTVEQDTHQNTLSLIPSETPSVELLQDDLKVEPEIENSLAKKQPIRQKNSLKYSKRRKLRKASEASKPPVSNLSLSRTESLVIRSSMSEEVTPNQYKIEDGLSQHGSVTRTPSQNLKTLKTWRPLVKKHDLRRSTTISENNTSNNSSGGGENIERSNCPINYDTSNISKFEEKVIASSDNMRSQNAYNHLMIDTTYPVLVDDFQSLMNADKRSSTCIINIAPVELVSLTDLHSDDKPDVFNVKENKQHTQSITDSYQTAISEFPSHIKTFLNSTGINPLNENVSQIPKHESNGVAVMKADRKTLRVNEMLTIDTVTNLGHSILRISSLDNSQNVSSHHWSNFSSHSDGGKTIGYDGHPISHTDNSLEHNRVTFKLPTAREKRRKSIKKRFKLKNPSVTKSISCAREPNRTVSITSQASSKKSFRKALTLHRRRQKSETMPVRSQRSLTSRVWSQSKYWEADREREYAQRKSEILNKIWKSKEKRNQS